MVPSDWALATFYYRLSIVTMSICSSLAAIFSGKFQDISRFSKTVRDRAKVAVDH